MTRIFAAMCLFLAVITAFLYFKVEALTQKNTALKSEKNELMGQIKGYQNEIEEFNKAQERASQTIEKVRTVIKTVKADCDCYHAELPDDVRRLLGGAR